MGTRVEEGGKHEKQASPRYLPKSPTGWDSRRKMNGKSSFKIAAVQETPVYLDRDATVELVAEQVAKAATDGADLLVFPESFVPGYPDWVWRKPLQDHDFYERFLDQAVDLDSDQLAPVFEAARESGTWVALGLTERSHSGTLYNTVVYIDRNGDIVDRHRKLKPTSLERTVWGEGQEHLLTVVEMDGVRVGSLICWENYMPLARAAMFFWRRPGITAMSGLRHFVTPPKKDASLSSGSLRVCVGQMSREIYREQQIFTKVTMTGCQEVTPPSWRRADMLCRDHLWVKQESSQQIWI